MKTLASAETIPLEMTKWFGTNYHYMVPEFSETQRFTLASTKPVDEYREARAQGYQTRPVLLGPVTYLKLGKSAYQNFDPLALLGNLLPVYVEVLRRLRASGAGWVQMDEPCLVLDLDEPTWKALRTAASCLIVLVQTERRENLERSKKATSTS